MTVSKNEATRLEEETKRRLLKGRRLSLVVDLDQTIIHATVDPTVGEWKDDPSNPNHEYVKDVKAFQLNDEVAGGRGCWYYVKMRPGLKDFLENIAKLYELHIYTMGTRAYAMAVAKIVDPEGKIFGNRVLSRDESGSMTQKSLHRLFPVDQKMVVIIDDREDVWKWSPNLIKVRPYNFFVGIGDINSSFLPKRAPEPVVNTEQMVLTKPETKVEKTEEAAPNPTDLTTLEQLVTMGAGENKLLLDEQSDKLSEAIKVQQELRPLAKQQQALDEKDDAEMTNAPAENGDDSASEGGKHRHHLLHDDDRELFALEKNLRNVHKRFFDEYDNQANPIANRVSHLRGERKLKRRISSNDPDNLNLDAVPEIQTIMPAMKRQSLAGCVLVFSGVIPLHQNIRYSDIGMWAKLFGAELEEHINGKVTHLIAARSRTAKVRQAAGGYPHIKIVTPKWLYDCISRWEKVDEKPYLIAIHPEDRFYRGPDILENGIIPADQESVLSDEESDDGSTDMDDIESLGEGNVPDLAEVDWEDTNRELEEFLNDDDSDSADDSDSSMKSTGTTESEADRDSRSTESEPRPAKRNRSRTPSNADTDSEGDTHPESRLSKRRKKARERHSGLRRVELAIPSPRAASPTGAAAVASTQNGTGAPTATETVAPAEGVNSDEDSDSDDGFDEAFEKELMAELEEG